MKWMLAFSTNRPGRVFRSASVHDAFVLYEKKVRYSETWLMKVEHEVKMDMPEISMIRWMFSFTLKERKSSDHNITVLYSIFISVIRWVLYYQVEKNNNSMHITPP